MPTKTTRSLALTLALLLAGCASTQIVDSWTAPGLTPADLQFQHIVAIAVLPDLTNQRVAEDALAATAKQTRISPAYALLSAADRSDAERLRATLSRAGVDGAVTVRLVRVEDKETYVPGTTHVIGGGYYGYYSRVYVDPGHYRTDTFVHIETTLHDVENGKLLWSGTSKSMNPSNVRAAIRGVMDAARGDLRKQGLLP